MNPVSHPQSGRRFAYQQPDATMTLREGLAEYFESNPELEDPEAFEDPEAGELFACHDAVHIVFGTNTEIKQEAMTDMWAMWGTDVGWRRYMAYLKQPAATDILKKIGRELGWWHVIRESFGALPYIWRVRKYAKRMHKRWPFHDWKAQLDRPLAEIRAEYGIEFFDLPEPRGDLMPAMP